MKKIILSILMLGILFMIIGSVSAVNFVKPTGEGDEYFSGNLVVDWDNLNSTNGLYLQYNNCTGGTWTNLNGGFAGDDTDYLWDTTEVVDGDYCLRLEAWEIVFASSGLFTIDNTDPTADFTYEGILIVGEEIEFDAGDSYDENDIETFVWDFGDGSDEIIGEDDVVDHAYSEAGTYEVVLTVTDFAGNEDTTTETIVIEPIEVTDTFFFEAGILGIKDLEVDVDTFDTGMDGVDCEFVNPDITDEMDIYVDSDGDGNCTLDWADIPYKYRGVQNFVVKATGEIDIKYFNVEITVYTWMIDLEEGWNLVSIPMMPEETSINAVLGNIIENVAYEGTSTYTIFNYNAVNGKWYKARKYEDNSGYSGPTSYKLTTIVPGYGYWINMENADTLKGIGSIAPEIEGPLLGVEVANGWNLIGHYGLLDLSVEESLTSLIMGPSDWKTNYYDAVVTEDGYMYPYEGYWMTAKFIPNGVTLYTPSQNAINSVLEI